MDVGVETHTVLMALQLRVRMHVQVILMIFAVVLIRIAFIQQVKILNNYIMKIMINILLNTLFFKSGLYKATLSKYK